MGKPDFFIVDHGSVVLLTASTERAREWVDERLPEDRTSWGSATVVEPRYIVDIVDGICAEGLRVQVLR